VANNKRGRRDPGLQRGSRLVASGSRLVASGSWLVARGSRLTARGSWLVARGSWLAAHSSRVSVRFPWNLQEENINWPENTHTHTHTVLTMLEHLYISRTVGLT
jgi:hypothetical protein